MTTRIANLLLSLYGPDTSGQTLQSVERLVAACRSTLDGTPALTRPPQLTEKDALLITYADQLQQPGQAPLQTLTEFCEAHLRGVITGVHLLPFYPWSSDDGFSVRDYFSVDPAVGAWEDVKRLGESFDLMFDAVLNHLSAQSDWFQRFLRDEEKFRDFFVTVEGKPDLSRVVRPRALPLLTEFETVRGPRRIWTTFSEDQVDLNYRNLEVLLAALEVLLFYVRQGARFIRLDAIAFLWKEAGTSCLHLPQTHQIIQIMRAVLDEVAPGVFLVTETNVPHEDNVSYFGNGANEAQLVYNFALPPLTLHSFATGNAGKLAGWARELATPSPQTTFFNFLASHDGIGLNPARGLLSEGEVGALVERALEHGGCISYKEVSGEPPAPYEMNINYLDALSNPKAGEPAELAARKAVTAHGILLSLRGVPGLYAHSLFGSRGDRAGAESSGIKRRVNRQKLCLPALERELADGGSLRGCVFSGLRSLLRRRRESPAFAPAGSQDIHCLDERVFSVLRASPDGRDVVFCHHNVSAETVTIADPRTGDVTLEPYGMAWRPCQGSQESASMPRP